MNAFFNVPQPLNEPPQSYALGTPERAALKAALADLRGRTLEIPLIIGGREVRTGNFGECRIPHDHGHILARYHKAGPAEIRQAIQAARNAWAGWSRSSWQERVAISLKASELLSKHRRYLVNAATMLGQSKTAHQAEIDAACELIDFLRFNTYFMQQIYQTQPENFQATWNRMEYRPLEGFVFAIAPFNFTAIGGNLAAAPAVMGNVVLWKPASTGVYSAYQVMRVLMDAGLPDGVINFVPGDARDIGDYTLSQPDLAGVHFTGSNPAFNHIWRVVAGQIGRYRSYPRIVGETGGKDFVVAHTSAEIQGLATCLLRGAFEYQGQKCSATSRAYIPRGIWPALRDALCAQLDRVKVGPVEDFANFMGAVIDRPAFERIREYIRFAQDSPEAEVIYGGGTDDTTGYFVQPTVVLTTNPQFKLMEEEIFGPVLTVFLYDDDRFPDILDLCDATSPYALTGAVFARDRAAIGRAEERLRHAAGNFYINDKTTGAVVGHQPFGGARASGTNDKAGSIYNLLRWISVRTIKECFNTPQDFAYPFLAE
ncbi:MAG TPA: L-glutamate gamma-semialdehyde dehydrogenase [Acidobacteriota bacterium]|nr:L-glutamate gamma-semialdehyde dehydrogenase [Acidobacteriota bacterium]HQG92772.1 L-glutamate gamma-semialdehyde dehydrogenase [Acidobacteriota bacterium]